MKKPPIGAAAMLVGAATLAGTPSTGAGAQTLPACLPELTPDRGDNPPPADDDCDEVGNPNEGGNPGNPRGGFYPTPNSTAAML